MIRSHACMISLGQDPFVREPPSEHGAAVSGPTVHYATPLVSTLPSRGRAATRGRGGVNVKSHCHKVTQILCK